MAVKNGSTRLFIRRISVPWLFTLNLITSTDSAILSFSSPHSKNNFHLFFSYLQVVENLLNDLTQLPLKSVSIMNGGTQVKLIFTFENDQQAVFKPMRYISFSFFLGSRIYQKKVQNLDFIMHLTIKHNQLLRRGKDETTSLLKIQLGLR